MNKFAKIVIGIVAVVVVTKTVDKVMGVSEHKGKMTPSELKNTLIKIVNDSNAKLPKVIDSTVELTRVELIGDNTLRYNYKLTQMGDSEQEKTLLEQNTIKTACNGPTKGFLKENITVEFMYTSGINSMLVSVPPSKCI